jgi:hypothetical protein
LDGNPIALLEIIRTEADFFQVANLLREAENLIRNIHSLGEYEYKQVVSTQIFPDLYNGWELIDSYYVEDKICPNKKRSATVTASDQCSACGKKRPMEVKHFMKEYSTSVLRKKRVLYSEIFSIRC